MVTGGWAAFLVVALMAGSAQAADGSGHGAGNGSAGPRPHAHGPHAVAGGPRGEGHPAHVQGDDDGAAAPDAPGAADPVTPPVTDPAAPADPAAATTEDPEAPRSDIGTALGPIGLVTAAGGATGSVALGGGGGRPLLSFDAPTPFAPRAVAGGLRGAPGARSVQVAIRRGGPRHGCGWWTARSARFTAARRSLCAAPRWMPASLRRSAGGWRWRAALGASLTPGSYHLLVRVLDAGGRAIAFDQS